MYLQRRFRNGAMQQYQKGKFGGFLHLYIGQEAISTGTVFAFNNDDDIITAYRDVDGDFVAASVPMRNGGAVW